MIKILLLLLSSVHAESGIASVFSEPQGLACGGRLSQTEMGAAHKTLPCGTKVLVTNMRNGKSAVVTIRDRGPYVRGRIIDLMPAAARALGVNGLAPVTVDVQR